MRKLMTAVTCLSLFFFISSGYVLAAEEMDHSAHAAPAGEASHADMDHGDEVRDGTFIHAEMVDGIHVEFQVMDLASMNMKDPAGKTHHVMVSFLKEEKKIEQAAGKVKVIAPSGKEQVAILTHYGSGVFAANFIFDEPGKWGVICLFKEQGTQHMAKFWYPHQEAERR